MVEGMECYEENETAAGGRSTVLGSEAAKEGEICLRGVSAN